MITILNTKSIAITWRVTSAPSQNAEHFESALLAVFAIGRDDVYPLLVSDASGSTFHTEVPSGMPIGTYDLKAVWVKDTSSGRPLDPSCIDPAWPTKCISGVRREMVKGRSVDGCCVNHKYDHRCLMCQYVEGAFAITDVASEETDPGKENPSLTIKSVASPYGLDGLSAYESAVLRGVWSGTESEYLGLPDTIREHDEEATAHEAVRVSAEAARQTAETARAAAEDERASKQIMYDDSERVRAQNESERRAYENSRLDAEEERGTAELLRQREFEQMKGQLEELIEEGGIGEVNVQADWNEENDTKDSYIQNKPDVYTKSQTDLAIRNAMVGNTIDSGDVVKVEQDGSSKRLVLRDNRNNVISGIVPSTDTSSAWDQELDTVIPTLKLVKKKIEAIDVSSQISGKADKSEMSVSTSGDKTTITLKQEVSAEVINQHQDISGKQDVISDLATIRSGATAGATAVQPATMNTALAGKQDTLTFDSTPTASSTNPVTSGGVKSALDVKADKSDTYTKAEIGNLITPIDSEVIVGALPASGVANKVYRVPSTNSYTDYGWDGTQFVALATYDGDLTAAVGYYDCPTVATTAAKVVSASGYVLAKGGCFKVKFAHANNVGNPTLNVNGTGAKPLYWEGETPTLYEGWKDNEVVSIYYDGTSYQAHRIYESLKDLMIYTGVRLISTGQTTSTASLNRPLFGAPLMERGKEYLIVVRVDATITITQLMFGTASATDLRILPRGSYTLEAGKDYVYWFTPSIEGCDRLYLDGANTAGVNTVVRIYEKVDEDVQTSLSLIRANVANVDSPYLNSSWTKGALQAGRVNTSNNRFVSEFLRYPYDITLTVSQGFMQIVYTYTDGESSLLSDYTVNTITIPANTIFRVGVRRVTEQSVEDDSAAAEFGHAIQIGNLISKELPTLNLFGAAISGYALQLSSVNVGDYVIFNKYTTALQRTLVIPVKEGQVLNVHCRNYSPYAPVIFIGLDSQLLGGLLAASGTNLEAKGEYTAPADGYAILNHNISYFAPYCYVVGLTADSLRENHLKTSIRQLYDTPRYDNLLRQGQNKGVQTYRQSLSLLWFSDIHGNQTNVERIVEFEGMYHRYFNDIIHTGDSVTTVADDSMDFWTNVKGSNKILNIVGNHDSARRVDGALSWYELTEQETYQLLFSTVSDWGVTQPSDAASAGKCYYYKDYDTEKVRLIAIDGMSANPSQTRYDSEQVAWFSQTLTDARANGRSVVVACHFAPQHHNIDSPWSNSVGYTGAPPYATLEDFVSAIGDFIDAGGEFVCWMCGDTHIDEFGLVNSDERQLVIVVASAGSYFIKDFARSAFSETQDLFNVFCVNTQLKVVKLLRIGCDTDINHSKRVPYAYNYVTKERVSRI